jgi:hypothetical protein
METTQGVDNRRLRWMRGFVGVLEREIEQQIPKRGYREYYGKFSDLLARRKAAR